MWIINVQVDELLLNLFNLVNIINLKCNLSSLNIFFNIMEVLHRSRENECIIGNIIFQAIIELTVEDRLVEAIFSNIVTPYNVKFVINIKPNFILCPRIDHHRIDDVFVAIMHFAIPRNTKFVQGKEELFKKGVVERIESHRTGLNVIQNVRENGFRLIDIHISSYTTGFWILIHAIESTVRVGTEDGGLEGILHVAFSANKCDKTRIDIIAKITVSDSHHVFGEIREGIGIFGGLLEVMHRFRQEIVDCINLSGHGEHIVVEHLCVLGKDVLDPGNLTEDMLLICDQSSWCS